MFSPIANAETLRDHKFQNDWNKKYVFHIAISALSESLFSATWEALSSILLPWTLSANSQCEIKNFLFSEKSPPLFHYQSNDLPTNFIVLTWLWCRLTARFRGFEVSLRKSLPKKRKKSNKSHNYYFPWTVKDFTYRQISSIPCSWDLVSLQQLESTSRSTFSKISLKNSKTMVNGRWLISCIFLTFKS